MLLTRKFGWQPQFPAQLDTAGLGRGVQLLLNPVNGPIDQVSGRIWAPGGNAKVDVGMQGTSFLLDGVDDHYTCTASYPEITGSKGTFFIWCPVVGPPDNFGSVLFGDNGTYFWIDNIGRVYAWSLLANGGYTGWFNTTNRSLVFSSNGTTAGTDVYIDGGLTTINFTGSLTGFSAANKTLRLGAYANGNAYDFNGKILLAGYSNRKWDISEAREFHYNPYAIFRQSREIWPALPSIGPSETNLDIANASQSNVVSTGAVTQTHALAFSSATQANSASEGTVAQVHALAIANATQANLVDDVEIGVGAVAELDIANATQTNTAGAGGVTQEHILSWESSTQQNAASTPAISQTHALTVPNLTQPNSASDGEITGDTVVNLTISASVQPNTAEADGISQTHVLVITASAQENSASTVSVTQIHALTPASATQNNLASDGAVVSYGDLAVADLLQSNTLSGGNVTTIQTLTIASAEQDNRVSSGALIADVVFEAAMAATTTVIQRLIKKPGIPHDTEQWLRTMLEIIVGRRGNKISVPQQQNLTFSGTPTKAEVESLYAYTNQVRSALEQLINRLDS